jgi:ATPase subunit of ABC transporter with duplicated ATPase domains
MPRTLLSADALVRAHGPRTILAGVSLSVDDESRIALVGRNGSGKSTLLRLLAGLEAPDAGQVVRGHGVAVLHLPQLDEAENATPVRTILHERLGVASAAARMDALAAELACGRDVIEAHAAALEDWLARGDADLDARLDRGAAAAELEPTVLDRPAAQLSGGQRARAMLAAIDTARAGVLLLDEPTNHLDADGLAGLRALLQTRRGGLVLVAHDRALLGEVTNRVAELDAHAGALIEYRGGWAAYETERLRADNRASDAHDRATGERARLRARERAARSRAAKGHHNARSENDRSLRHLYEQSAQRGSDGLAAQLARRAERVEIPDRPWREKPTSLRHVADASRSGVIAALQGAVLARGAFALGPPGPRGTRWRSLATRRLQRLRQEHSHRRPRRSSCACPRPVASRGGSDR